VTDFEQHAVECDEHPRCTVVVGTRDGQEIWRSHNRAELPPGVRINVDEPAVENRLNGLRRPDRWTLALPEHLPIVGWTPDDQRRVAFQARRRDLFTARELAALKDVLGINAADLEFQANEAGWDREPPDPPK
jgi:hypothetical protein